MAIERLHIEKFLELSKHNILLDVRSPAEYEHAHIPGALSIPLFTNEERKIVGTAYKQESRETAIRIGLEFFGPRMTKIIDEVEMILKNSVDQSSSDTHSASRLIFIYCWRGGMRSAGVAWLLDLYGFKVYTLAGGYKSYRNHVLDIFKLPLQLQIVGGYTGSDKTGLLKQLAAQGEAVIDLESIARHKGSAFGSIGMPEQPGQEMFENLLAAELKNKLTGTTSGSTYPRPIWLEDESQRIGLVNIPMALWANMRNSPVYFLDIPFEERLQHIVREYGNLDIEKLKNAISRIREKLGGLNAKNAISLLEQGETLESFRILLGYYDKLYLKALHNRQSVNSLLHSIECKSITPENAKTLIRYKVSLPEKV